MVPITFLLSFLPWNQYLKVIYILRFGFGTDLVHYESELHFLVTCVPCPMLTHMGTTTVLVDRRQVP